MLTLNIMCWGHANKKGYLLRYPFFLFQIGCLNLFDSRNLLTKVFFFAYLWIVGVEKGRIRQNKKQKTLKKPCIFAIPMV